MKMLKIKYILLFSITIVIVAACENPFAPKLNTTGSNGGMLNSQETIDGVFENFSYAYIFKDTLVYGNLFTPDFVFIYRNYDKGTDETWGRDQEMLTTYRLFQASQSLDLVWNEILINVGDSLVRDVSRSFNLTITFNPSDIIRISGIANLRLKRSTDDGKWRIQIWRDESNY